jgi:excisionase family DNA binding protein
VPPALIDRSPAPAADREWLSLGPASRLLGVDPDTLRRWADDGRVEAYTTPGGHRRFERSALERLATSRRGGPRPLASLGATPEGLSRAYRRSYSGPRGRDGIATTAMAPGDREAYRHDGRRLVAALVDYLDADPHDGTARATTEREAHALVDDLARRLSDSGTSLPASVALFVAARRPFVAELASLGRRRALDPARLGALYEDATNLLDRLLLRLIETHERRSA